MVGIGRVDGPPNELPEGYPEATLIGDALIAVVDPRPPALRLFRFDGKNAFSFLEGS